MPAATSPVPSWRPTRRRPPAGPTATPPAGRTAIPSRLRATTPRSPVPDLSSAPAHDQDQEPDDGGDDQQRSLERVQDKGAAAHLMGPQHQKDVDRARNLPEERCRVSGLDAQAPRPTPPPP